MSSRQPPCKGWHPPFNPRSAEGRHAWSWETLFINVCERSNNPLQINRAQTAELLADIASCGALPEAVDAPSREILCRQHIEFSKFPHRTLRARKASGLNQLASKSLTTP